jgi:hypothetical protein
MISRLKQAIYKTKLAIFEAKDLVSAPHYFRRRFTNVWSSLLDKSETAQNVIPF